MGAAESGRGNRGGHVFDGAEGYRLKFTINRHRLDAVGPDLGWEIEGADGFAEEGGFAGARLGKGDLDAGAGELDGEAGEAGAGAEVEQGSAGAEVGRCEEALAEVAADDLLGGADSREVDSGVPFEDEVEVEEELGGKLGGDGGVGGEERGEGFGGHGRYPPPPVALGAA